MKASMGMAAAMVAICVVGAGGTGKLFAADKPKKELSFGTGKGAGPYLTKEELRNCLAEQPRLARQDADLKKERADLDGVKADIARGGDDLKSQLETLDRSSAEAVAAYNDKAQARDRQIDDYQAKVTAFNARVDTGQSEHANFDKACQNRRYFEEDEMALKKGK
jgi:hypothetical protein